MRAVLIAILATSTLAAASAAQAGVKPGLYECRTPAGTETGATFTLGRGGVYGDADGNVAGQVRQGTGELVFSGGDKNGSHALIISDTRIKVGKRIFCEWQKPKPAAAPAVQAEAPPPEPERPKAKLIVVKPDLRR
jgi:hypothetical protein